jgi:hypothetical protein
MSEYGVTNNICQSIIDYLKDELSDAGLTTVNVVSAWNDDDKESNPVIAVNIGATQYLAAEIGSHQQIEYFPIEIDVYATRNIEKRNLGDWLGSVLVKVAGVPYYEYTIADEDINTNAALDDSEEKGLIQVLRVVENRDIVVGDTIEKHKKYHRFISLLVFLRRE